MKGAVVGSGHVNLKYAYKDHLGEQKDMKTTENPIVQLITIYQPQDELHLLKYHLVPNPESKINWTGI